MGMLVHLQTAAQAEAADKMGSLILDQADLGTPQQLLHHKVTMAEQGGCKAVLEVVVVVVVLHHRAVLHHQAQVVTEGLVQHLQYLEYL